MQYSNVFIGINVLAMENREKNNNKGPFHYCLFVMFKVVAMTDYSRKKIQDCDEVECDVQICFLWNY